MPVHIYIILINFLEIENITLSTFFSNRTSKGNSLEHFFFIGELNILIKNTPAMQITAGQWSMTVNK